MSRLDGVQTDTAHSPLDIIKRVLVANEAAPIEDMERLVALGGADPEFRLELLRGTADVLDADPPTLVPCWLALIVGELGASAVEPLLSALGTSEGEALDEAILPVLTRLAVPAYDAITAAIEDSPPEDAGYRADLYGVLAAVAVANSDALRERLRDFVLCRVDRWRMPFVREDGEPEATALTALVHMVAPEIIGSSGLGGQAPAGTEEGDAARPGSALERQIANLSRVLAENWRDTARDLERRYGRAV